MSDDEEKTRILNPIKDDPDGTVQLNMTEITPDESCEDATVIVDCDSDATEIIDCDSDATEIIDCDSDATEIIDCDSDATEIIDCDSDATEIIVSATDTTQPPLSVDQSPSVGVGSVINNRFNLEKLLGRGGMGDVYLATDRRKLEAQDKNPHVALKVLGENFKKHPQAFIALQREARKTQALAHPNIVTVYDFDRQNDIVYLTMEALVGKPMDEELRTDTRPLEDAISMIDQCAHGLAYAHKKSLVHSDLKPGNIFITDDGAVKLLDFGIARAFKSGKDIEAQAQAGSETLFDAGDLGALTPAYASLDMLEGETPHPADDVYALGLIAYELLTGKHPYERKMASKAKELGLTAERVKGLNKQQWRAIEKALVFQREKRTQNAQVFLDEFNARSKAPLYIASSIITMAFITLGSFNYFVEPEIGPSIEFIELPIESQNAVNQHIKEADTALAFQDFNSAILHLDKAFIIHEYNPIVMARIDTVVAEVLAQLALLDEASQIKLLDNLQEYRSLANNKSILDYKNSL